MLTVIWRDQADHKTYEAARVRGLFNREIPDKYPRAVAFAESEHDVVDAVKLALEHKCCLSVRSGGQSWPVWCVRDEAMMVDLGGHKEIEFDETTGVVKVSPSTTGYDLNEYLSSKGRIFSIGHCPDVGVGGALLCGGMGWNCNNWGFACEHVVALDVVTADAELIRADSHQNTDLFWASKGAGPAFPGIVTRFHIQTRPSPVTMLSSGYVYPISRYTDAFPWIVKIADGFKSSIEAVAVGSYAGTNELCITIALLATGDDECTLRTELQRIEDSHPSGTVAHWFCEQTGLRQEFHTKAKAYPPDHRYSVDCAFLDNDSNVVNALERAFTTVPNKTSLVLWNTMIPRSRQPLTNMALSVQSDHYFAIYGVCELDGDYASCKSWVHDNMLQISKHAVGTYTGEFDPQARGSKTWSSHSREQLTRIKKDRDPQGRFCSYPGLENVQIEARKVEYGKRWGLLSLVQRFLEFK